VFLEATIMGLLPVLSKTFTENPTIISLANAFSGGVFLAICTLHIMPEQTESWIEMDDSDLPLPFALLVSGYTLILVLDRVLFDSHDDPHKDHELQDNLIKNKADEICKSIG